MNDECKTLIVRHLPQDLDEDDCNELLVHFGASHVRYMGNKGRMKNTAFATFENQQIAASALKRLHQLEILNTRLVVEFSTDKFEIYHPSDLKQVTHKCKKKEDAAETQKIKRNESENSEKERRKQVTEDVNSLSPAWNFEYPFNPKLQYMYPAPTITILMNIANALASVPKFYVQVLHLMNKMNLPAPFGLQTCMPPVPDDVQPPLPPDQIVPPQPAEDMECSSTEESEIESDEEKKLNVSTRKRPRGPSKKQSMKKLKLQLQMDTQMQAIAGIMPRSNVPVSNPTEIFEQPQQQPAAKKIEFKLAGESSVHHAICGGNENSKPSEMITDVSSSGGKGAEKLDSTTVVDDGGFGKIEPAAKIQPRTENNKTEFSNQEFISEKEIKAGRLSEKEMKELPVFKKYELGEPSANVCIRNLAKPVTETDLHQIFGRYVDWNDDNHKLRYNINILTGRLRGRAFISLPDEEKAKTAIDDCNGFVLHGKPIVVEFSRSAKVKQSSENE